ncbi:MAG TPA: SRPBCC family protein, partial [Gaiellaceae bacterium]|nr:SRPBCC family protein [Gaiellaceae bacterium]
MRYAREIEVPKPVDETFAYLADFTHTAEWDPGIAEARRLTPAPTAGGSRFEVVALFRGKRQRFEYVVTAYEEGRRIALRGEGEKAISDDVIVVSPS